MYKSNRAFRFGVILLEVTTLSVLLTCSSQEEADRKALFKEKLDPRLAKISPGLAMISANTAFMAEIHCVFAKILKEGQSQNAVENQIIERMLAEPATLCGVFRKAEAYTSQLAKSALKTKKVPSDDFLFYAWKGEGATAGGEVQKFGFLTSDKGDEPIGLFETLEDCKAAEKVFRDLDISTRPCRAWIQVQRLW